MAPFVAVSAGQSGNRHKRERETERERERERSKRIGRREYDIMADPTNM